MIRAIRGGLVAVALLIPLLASPTPAAAELESPNTISWGVTGLATGTQTDTIKSNVFAIEQIGNRIYVGGRFLQATNGATSVDQPFLAAFNATTGEFDWSFTPELDRPVYALQRSADNSTLFIGGEFNTINGVNRRAIAALDPATGEVKTDWSGRVSGSAMVRGLDVQDGNLYVGGRFTTVTSAAGTDSVTNAVRFNGGSGRHDRSWRPTVEDGTVWSITASPTADRVYLAGYFHVVNGEAREGGFAALTKSSGQNATGVQPFKYNSNNPSRRYSYDVEVAGGNVFVGGSEHFVQVLRESDLQLEKFHYTDPRGDFQDLEVVGDRVYAGCHCGKGADYWMSNDRIWFRFNAPAGETNGAVQYQATTTWVMAFDAATGEHIPSFSPALTSNNAGIWAIHGTPDGCLWLGGQISGDGTRSANNMLRLCDNVVDNERPSPPRGLTLSGVQGSDVNLTWTASTDNNAVAGYYVYDRADGSVVATATTNSVTLQGVAVGSHTYFVKAFDAAGNTSWRSNYRSADVVDGGGNPLGCTIWGTEGDDVINGTSGPDVICALGGNDVINGGSGDDVIYSGPGNDDVEGGGGDDQIFGGLGDDVVRGGGDNDFVDGNEGNDVVTGWNGIDYLVGGTGDDVLVGGDGDDVMLGHDGNDTFWSGNGNDDVEGGDGNDYVYGEAGNDILRGGADDDHVVGGEGDDVVNGWRGDDFLDGGSGNNNINGGDGTDACYGGGTKTNCE